jgi:transposase-like protein
VSDISNPVTCPLCQSAEVHPTGKSDALAIYACEVCSGQFTIAMPRPKRGPYIWSLSDTQRYKKLRI